MHQFLKDLEFKFEGHRNREDAGHMKAYMKNQFEFFGIKQGPRRNLLKESWKEQGVPPYEDLNELIREMFERPEREWQHSAIDLMLKHLKNLKEEDIELIEWSIVNKSWWDTVDGISAWITGPFLKSYPQYVPARTDEWIENDNFWMQRMAILFQLKYKEELDFELLKKYILRRKTSKEFFIQKASGWILRHHSRRIPGLVTSFVEANPELSNLTKREALRLLK